MQESGSYDIIIIDQQKSPDTVVITQERTNRTQNPDQSDRFVKKITQQPKTALSTVTDFPGVETPKKLTLHKKSVIVDTI